ncbi:MAG TPA: alpha/beta fold hydrolase, partial [Aggregatilineaceae bacterium]|nr:alpha/beta fold hydrolase [Aggregatilineaceae bacterium]
MGRSGHWLIMIALVAVVAGVFPAHRQVYAQERDPQAVAQALVDNVLKGDFEAATADFDAAMQATLSANALKQGWQSVEQQVGAFQQQIGVQTQQVQGYMVVVITLQFEKAALDVQVSVDAQGKVAGLYTGPANSAATALSPPYELPDYADSTAYEEQDVAVGAGTEWELPGTLTSPVGDGPFPAVVLVHGSGPNDRDETIAGNKPFRDLALGLASQGIAVLRYDKRTLVYGQKMAAMSDLTVQDETISDALAAVALLRETDKIDPARIVVLGHSLGANLAPRIGQQDLSVAGLILMAGNARPLELLVLQQT